MEENWEPNAWFSDTLVEDMVIWQNTEVVRSSFEGPKYEGDGQQ